MCSKYIYIKIHCIYCLHDSCKRTCSLSDVVRCCYCTKLEAAFTLLAEPTFDCSIHSRVVKCCVSPMTAHLHTLLLHILQVNLIALEPEQKGLSTKFIITFNQ